MYSPLVYGTYMATVDAFMLGLLKAMSLGWINTNLLFIPALVYAIQPFIFYKSLSGETMTVMNLLWDVLSDVFVTFEGLYFFQEKITQRKMWGVALSFVSIALLSA
jgi:multidrug transporter EmrE-like cation transporter